MKLICYTLTVTALLLAACQNPYEDAVLDKDYSSYNDISAEEIQIVNPEALEYNLHGSEATVYVRFKLQKVAQKASLLSKGGESYNKAYTVALIPQGDSVLVNAALGSDEIAGAHELNYAFPKEEIGKWQDVIYRFNGKISQLFVNGVLRDDEVTVGTVRDWNTHPVTVGSDFQGTVGRVALWDRYLSDSEVAKVSGVASISEGLPDYYNEAYRPQFHFTAQKNWINDPNGLVWYDGIYHLFFQYMPLDRPGAYKDWGHAVSTDLVHWTQTKEGQITPHRMFAGCWSGSAVVDEENVSGLQTGQEKTIIAYITNGGWPEAGLGPSCTQCIAYSNDGGKSFIYYDGNPLIRTMVRSNRDPKVVWDEQHKIWVMSLYMDRGADYAIFTSRNLLDWAHASDFTLAGDNECPGFMPLPVDGEQTGKWIFYGAKGVYQIGTFDGAVFTPESGPVPMDHGRNFYAAQTWNNSPDGRCIHIAWMAGDKYPGMPFEQQLSFPTELTLRTTPDGIRVFRKPVDEIKSLYEGQLLLNGQIVTKENNLLDSLCGDLYDMTFETSAAAGSDFDLMVRGATIHFDAAAKLISVKGPTVKKAEADLGSMNLRLASGKLKIRVLVDRTSIELFADDGESVITSNFMPAADNYSYALIPAGELELYSAEINALKSSWE